jgi:hypothetical protein
VSGVGKDDLLNTFGSGHLLSIFASMNYEFKALKSVR